MILGRPVRMHSADHLPARPPARRNDGSGHAGRQWPSFWLVVGLTAALLVAGCGQPGPPPARIAYVTPEGAVATIAASGGQPVLLSPPAPAAGSATVGGRVYSWPCWSPDGQRVAFMALDDPGSTGAVLVAAADGSQRVTVQEVDDGYPIYLSWSPDGSTVSMLTSGDDTLHLLLGAADGHGTARRVISGQPLYSTWAPDGRSLLVHSGGGGFFRSEIGRIHLVTATAEAAPEAIAVDPDDFRAPAWSPTGAYQVFSGDNGTGSPALFLRARDGSLRRFADISGPAAAVWSPSGDQLAWGAAAEMPYFYDGLQVATPDGRTRTRLTDEPIFAFFWSPDGTRIAYVTLDDEQQYLNLRVIPATGGTGRTVASFHPTREMIQLVTYFDQYAQSTTIWSPDSRRLVYAGWAVGDDQEQPPAIFTAPADGSAAGSRLTPGRIGFYTPSLATVPTPAPSPTVRRR